MFSLSMVAIIFNMAVQNRLFISELLTESIRQIRLTFTLALDCLRQRLTSFLPSGTRFVSIAFGANEQTAGESYSADGISARRPSSGLSSLAVNRH